MSKIEFDKELLERLINEQAESIIKHNDNFTKTIVSKVTQDEEMQKNLTTLIKHRVFKNMAKDLGFKI